MFENYQDIFNQRGLSYHQAMVKHPLARKDKFNNSIKLLDLQDNHLILDIPSGGFYINQFINCNVQIISLETSQDFVNSAHTSSNNTIMISQDFNHIPLSDHSIDRALSLAAVHHIQDKKSFYYEVYRVLKQQGIFCLADV